MFMMLKRRFSAVMSFPAAGPKSNRLTHPELPGQRVLVPVNDADPNLPVLHDAP